MKNLVYMMLMCLLLAACSQTTEPSAVATSSSNTAPADAAASTTTGEENTAVSAIPAITPATSVAEASSIRPQDWVKGANEPKVVIIEYGDFQ